MAQINLLPWREQVRKTKMMNFAFLMLGFVLLAIFAIVILHIYIDRLISHQQRRIDYLNTVLNNEQMKTNIIMQQKKLGLVINANLNYIFSLRNKSYNAVRILEEIVRTAPDDIALSKVTRKDNDIIIEGRAPSNTAITDFMDNLAKSKVFTETVLTDITGKGTAKGEERYFHIKTELQEGIAPSAIKMHG